MSPAYRKTVSVLCVGLLTIIVLSGCQRYSCDASTALVVTGDQANLVERSLLTHFPCAPPCWQGIVPGETNEQEARTILNDLEFIDPASFYEKDVDDGGKLLYWQTTFTDIRHNRNRLEIDKNGIVSNIAVDIFYTLTVDELIQELGDPDGVISRDYGMPDGSLTCRSVYVIWFEKGLSILIPAVDITKTENEHLITPDTTVTGAYYFPAVSSLGEYIDTFGMIPDEETFIDWAEVD